MKPLCVLHFEKGIFITVEWALKNGTKTKPADPAVKAIMRQNGAV
jgi:hypothetical protein